ncbi:MBOAT-2 domain-containing protein [Mycena sanguinolenta]|uniref:MBOAT-2 domain-containing protein n=1 Tax=Mycena sanguinolenta TaxID=230812 RepID=A0A8H7DIZ8_9AGAR|nr:MBOAT-2 domain-containing protein [Mycena sanguinolenta]
MRLWTLQCAMSLHVSVRSPLTLASFFHTFVPPWLLYYLLNVLAILGPTTFVYRLALLPVTLFMSYRAVVSLDIARGFLSTDLGRLEYLNHCMALLMFTIFTRSLVRTFSSQTPRRKDTRNQLAWDAADLTFNLRSVGWNLSAGMKVGPMRPLAPSAYLAATARSLAIHILILDCLLYIGQLLAPVGGVYDMTIADPFLRSVRTTVITFLVGLCVHSAIQISGDALGLVGVGLIGQSPSEWPPIFDSPWLATSLTDFWATRWHQIFRQDFVALGAKPLSLVAGRPGGVLGAFLMSGVLHYVGTWGNGSRHRCQGDLLFLDDGRWGDLGGVLEAAYWQPGERLGRMDVDVRVDCRLGASHGGPLVPQRNLG